MFLRRFSSCHQIRRLYTRTCEPEMGAGLKAARPQQGEPCPHVGAQIPPHPPPILPPSPRCSLDVLSLLWEKAKLKSRISFSCVSPWVIPVNAALRVKGAEREQGGERGGRGKKKGSLNKSCLFLLRGKKRSRYHKHPQGWLDCAAGGLDSVMLNHGRL